MTLVTIIYTFMTGAFSQLLLYNYSSSINYKYEKKFQLFSLIVTGFFYNCLWMTYGFSADFLILALSTTILINIALIDSFYLEIPDEHNLMILFLGISSVIIKSTNPTDAILGALVGGGLFLLMAILSRGGMGGGDIKLVASTGTILGLTKTLLCTYYSFIFAAVGILYAIYEAFKKKKKHKKLILAKEIPFGPYIVTSVLMIFLDLA